MGTDVAQWCEALLACQPTDNQLDFNELPVLLPLQLSIQQIVLIVAPLKYRAFQYETSCNI